MVGWNFYLFFYKEYFTEELSYYSTKQNLNFLKKDEMNSEALFISSYLSFLIV